MFKFIHTADIHLDSPLRGLERYEGAPVEQMRQATRRALENLVDLAVDRKVDFVLIAGDLYDGDWPDYRTGLFFVSQMVRLRESGIRVFVITGNHDAANRMTQSLPLPDNVRMLDHRTPETVLLDSLPVAIHGQGFQRPAVVENLAAEYPAAVPGRFNIGMLHTSATGREGHERYAPCSLDDLIVRGYDYWALGHVHRREVLCSEPPIVFCGNLQGRHVGESGPKSCTLVTVDEANHPHLAEHHVDVARWAVCPIDTTGAATVAEVLDRVRSGVRHPIDESKWRPTAMRVVLEGRCEAHRQLAGRPQRLVAEVRAVVIEASGGAAWLEKVVVRSRPAQPSIEAGEVPGPLGELLRQTAELRGDHGVLAKLVGEELATLKSKLPPELLEEDGAFDFDSAEALHAVIDDVEQMLIEQFVPQEDER